MSVHTVTVTAIPNTDLDLPEDQYIDAVQFTIECPKDANCSVWWECKQCSDYDPSDDESDDGEYTRHGVFHQNIDGDWMTDSGDCAATHADSASDAMQEEAEEAGLGVHQIELDYEGDGYWSARRVIPPEERERIEAHAKDRHADLTGSRGPWEDEPERVREYFRRKAMDELRKTEADR